MNSDEIKRSSRLRYEHIFRSSHHYIEILQAMAMFYHNLSNFKLVILVFSILVQFSVGNEISGSGQRPKYYPSQEESKLGNGAAGRNRPLFGEGRLCPRNSPSGCFCWARPDYPSQHIFVNCTGTNKDIVPQVEYLLWIPLIGRKNACMILF